MASRHICPKCGGKEFITVVHVAEDWVVDEYGNFKEVRESGVCVVAWPDDGNTWTCANCGEEAVIVKADGKSK